MAKLSVIVCTYNPGDAVFKSCLEHIKTAAAHCQDIEVIVVDNHSDLPVSSRDYMASYTRGLFRVVVETKQGLTPARLKGIQEATGDLLVFVDDDNFIREDFLVQGLGIAEKNQHIGSYSGQVKLVFESEPPAWTEPYWGLLVCREFDKDVWSNLPHLSTTMPCGAGLFVRKPVAYYYHKLHEEGKRAIQLDRTGKSLFSGGDNDLAACACDLGLGVGLFHELMLEHFIPKSRLNKKYLVALAKGIATSTVVFKSFRNEYPAELSKKTKVANFVRLAAMDGTSGAFYKAVIEGEKEGRDLLRKLKPNNA
jgi:glycosyltransferase involved in cell wall biosynthesis